MAATSDQMEAMLLAFQALTVRLEQVEQASTAATAAAAAATTAASTRTRSPQRATPATSGMVVDTRIIGKPGNFSGEDADWKDWSTVMKAYSGACHARLGELMKTAEDISLPVECIPANVTLGPDDEWWSAQLY